MQRNIILSTDSYKLTHWKQYPSDARTVYSYFESRAGAEFPYTVFFGLQALLKEKLAGSVVRWRDLETAHKLSVAHFGNNDDFNYHGWSHIIEQHGGRLPLRIKAVPEGTPVPTGNVLMTIENTDPAVPWLTNAVESLLTHVWYPSTVATLSRTTFEMLGGFLDRTGGLRAGLPFMLHDFGYRGATSDESAAIGGAGHLVNGRGTDTLLAMKLAMEYYSADLDDLAFSVPATEHSVMTARGKSGEAEVVAKLLDDYPKGILSVVGDSYDIYRFVIRLGGDHFPFRKRILERDGVFVVRPDSITPTHKTPQALTVWIAQRLWKDFGGTENAKGFKVLDPHVRVLWGAGIDPLGIEWILAALAEAGFAAENMVFGMGGGLLQNVNRDTQRFAFKCSAMEREDGWHDVFKQPLDQSKASKKGRLQLSQFTDEHGDLSYVTLPEGTRVGHTLDARGPDDQRSELPDLLETVFEDGNLVKEYTFAEVRDNAKLPEPAFA